MNKIELTPAQKLAASRRSALLVSAAAGSGKTRVLTSRLMAYVTDDTDPRDIDEFLVITYTRAAAAELRGRILSELSRISGENPQNRRLRRQNSLCYRAHIGTIHSFCTAILRENGHLLGLSPDFSVGDEDKCLQLKTRALSKTLEAAYEKIKENPDFEALVGSTGAGRDDSRLVEAILDLHSKMQSRPYPGKWAQEAIAAMDISGAAGLENTIWGDFLLEEARHTVAFWSRKLDGIWQKLCENSNENAPLITSYGESITETISSLALLSRALDRGWDEAIRALPVPFPGLKALRNFEFPERKDQFTSLRDECKDALARLNAIFDAPSSRQLEGIAATAPAMRSLLELALELDRRFAAEKRRYGILDFSDLEHFAARLLCDGETGEVTPLAREISRRYREILVDEYQDVNAVQELIIRCVSKDGGNVFMVGDVKQSVYRFRLADPGIFLKKLESFPRAQDAKENESATVLLKNNFRSDRNILTACNSIFSALMTKRLGEIDYNEDCALFPPEDAPAGRGEVKICLVALEGGEDEEERPDKIKIEADFVAGRIRDMVSRGDTIIDGGELRPLRYGDIAILMRSPKTPAGIYANALTLAGVPVDTQQGGGFFTAPEIVVATRLLSVIDNPHSDVNLTAVLASPVFGFEPDDLAELRAAKRDGDIYGALCAYAGENQKGRSFLQTLEELRSLSCDLSVYELINYIYEKLSLPALWTAARKTDLACSNLLYLAELAAQFENGGWRGLSEFLSRLAVMEQRGTEPPVSGSGSHDTVKIMSIHKSKGLEFPVVFLCDTARKFNTTDLNSPVLVHSELGLGSKVTDTVRGIEYPSAAYRAVREKLKSELLSEEMRVLYVALTRAKEKLFVTAGIPKPEEFIKKLSGSLYKPPEAQILRKSQNFVKWLVTAALADETGTLSLETVYPERKAQEEQPDQLPEKSVTIDPEALENLRSVLDYRYPYEYAAALPSKITATALKEQSEEGSLSLLPPEPRSFDLPELFGASLPLTAGEKGTATHIAMQFIDFARTGNLEDIESEISRIHALGQLDRRQAEAVDKNAVLRFFASPVGARIRSAEKVYREFRFSLLVKAEEFFPEGGGEELLLQGVVDCCIEENGVLTVIDYKTDYVTAETLSQKAEQYRRQLETYAMAMERITGKRVVGGILCFLRAGLFYEI